MKRIFKIEMKRAFLNRMFAASLLIGLAVCTIQILPKYCPCSSTSNRSRSQTYTRTAFSASGLAAGIPTGWCCICAAPNPGGAAVCRQPARGPPQRLCENIFTRGKRRSYYTAKFISVFYPAARRQSCRCFGICTCPQCCCQVLCPTRLREPSGPKPRHCGLNNSIRSPISIRQSFVP